MRIRRTIVLPVKSETNTGIVNNNLGRFSKGTGYDLYLVDTMSKHDIKNGADVIVKEGNTFVLKQYDEKSYDIVLGVPVAKNEQLTDRIIDKFNSEFIIDFSSNYIVNIPTNVQVFIDANVNAFDKDGNIMDYAFEDSDYLEVQAILDEDGKVKHKSFKGEFFRDEYVPQLKINRIKEATCGIFENNVFVGEVYTYAELNDICIQVKEKNLEGVTVINEEGIVFKIDNKGQIDETHYQDGLYPTIQNQLAKILFDE